MDMVYVVETNKKFEDTVVSLLKSVDKKGWTVFGIYDLQERLAAKGFSHQPTKIVEICSAKHGNAMLSKNRLVSVCMPCRISVFEESGKTKIATVKPSMLVSLFDGVSAADVAELEKDVIEIVENSK